MYAANWQAGIPAIAKLSRVDGGAFTLESVDIYHANPNTGGRGHGITAPPPRVKGKKASGVRVFTLPFLF